MYTIGLTTLFLVTTVPLCFGNADPSTTAIWKRFEDIERQDKEQSSEINMLKHQVTISNQKLEIISGLNEDLQNDLAAKTKKLEEQDGIIEALKKDMELQKLEAERNRKKIEILALEVKKLGERSEEKDQSFVHPETYTEELNDVANDEEEETSATDMTKKLFNTSTGNTERTPDHGKVKNRHNRSITSKRFLTNGVPEGPVAFHAVAAGGRVEHLGINQNIVFETVNLNLGGGYLHQQGIFTAPKSGLYIFSASVMSYINAKSEIAAAIVKNGVIAAYAYGHGDSGRHDQGSVTVVMQLNAGDVVSVQNKYIADDSFYGSKYTSFTGILVAEM